MRLLLILLILVCIVFVGYVCLIKYPMYDGPSYRVLSERDGIEVREYPPILVALSEHELFPDSDKKMLINKSFKVLANYIFGKNKRGQKIEMMIPVMIVDSNDKIGLSFCMPAKFTLKTLPKPLEEGIHFQVIPARKVVAVRFSGAYVPKNLEKPLGRALNFIKNMKFEKKDAWIYAAYDNPMITLPFLRRNEIFIPIS